MFTCPIIYRPANDADRKEFIKHCEMCAIPFYVVTNSGDYCAIYTTVNQKWDGYIDFANVGSNLPLAKALSALRDDSDIWQLFYHKKNEYRWLLCNVDDVYFAVGEHRGDWIKATKRALIERFKI